MYYCFQRNYKFHLIRTLRRPESKSRLVREDEDDESDEEERISMAGIVSYTADREKRKEGLDAVIISG